MFTRKMWQVTHFNKMGLEMAVKVKNNIRKRMQIQRLRKELDAQASVHKHQG